MVVVTGVVMEEATEVVMAVVVMVVVTMVVMKEGGMEEVKEVLEEAIRTRTCCMYVKRYHPDTRFERMFLPYLKLDKQ